MTPGTVAIVRPGSRLGPAMGGVPVAVISGALDSITIEAATVRHVLPHVDLIPARIWWHKGAGIWKGPYDSTADAWAALRLVCASPESEMLAEFARMAGCPRGVEIISGGWRYRLAWGGDTAPERYGS